MFIFLFDILVYLFYRESRVKSNVTFHRNGTLSFEEPIYYYFEREKSIGPLSDTVTILDLVIAGISNQYSRCYGSYNCFTNSLTQKTLAGEIFNYHNRTIFKTYTVGDLLWGHRDDFLHSMSGLATMAGQDTPTTLGLFEGKNGTSSGLYTIFSGEGNMTAYQEIRSFRGLTEMNCWSTKYANMMNGTVGHGFPPFLKPDDSLKIFAGDLCRSSELMYAETQMLNGVEVFVYKPPRWASYPYPKNPDQLGFCTPDETDCPPEGLLNETACIGQPILMGKPHFLHADVDLLNSFEGLSPHPENHETFLYVEPLTGSIFKASKRLMFLFPYRESELSKQGGIKLHPNMKDGTTAFPLFWVNETVCIYIFSFFLFVFFYYIS